MNEITRIHLSRQSFTISVDAHKELKKYLQGISASIDSDTETINEIEARMAELLIERGITGDKVILLEDITYLQEQLGNPADFADEPGEESRKKQSHNSDASAPRKLFRDPQSGYIAGVASGLAAYFGIDATIVRIVFVLLTFFGGSGIAIYLILWIFMPEAKTAADRLQMHGKPVTLEAIKDFTERADVESAAKSIGKGIRRGVEILVKLLAIIIGLSLTLGSIAAFAAVVWAASLFLLAPERAFGGELIMPIGSAETWGFTMAAVSGLLLSVLLFVTGMAIMRRRWSLPTWFSVSASILLFASITVTGVLATIAVPQIRDRYQGLQRTQVKTVAPFSSVSANGHTVRVVYKASPEYKVETASFGNALNDIRTEVKDGALTIDASELNKRYDNCAIICLDRDNATVVVYAPALQAVKIGDNVQFRTESITLPALHIIAAHDASVDLVNIRFNTADVTRTSTNGTELRLTDLSPYMPSYTRVAYGQVDLGDAQQVRLTAPSACGAGSDQLRLSATPVQLMVNGKALNVQEVRENPGLNCVQIDAQ